MDIIDFRFRKSDQFQFWRNPSDPALWMIGYTKGFNLSYEEWINVFARTNQELMVRAMGFGNLAGFVEEQARSDLSED